MRQAGEGIQFDAQFVIATAVVGFEPDDTPEEREDKAIAAVDAKRAEVPNAILIDVVYVVFEADDTDEEKASKIAATELATARGTRFETQYVIAAAVVGVEPDDTPEEQEAKAIAAVDAKRVEVPDASLIYIVYVEFEADDTQTEKDRQNRRRRTRSNTRRHRRSHRTQARTDNLFRHNVRGRRASATNQRRAGQ